MQGIYGLGILKDHQQDYCLPMPSLEEIDQLFIKNGKEQILEWMKEYDSVITESNPDKLVIEHCINKRWKPLSDFIIEDSLILTFSFSELLEKENSQKILNILYNHFRNFLNKSYISNQFKILIQSMTMDKEHFLEAFALCNYDEQRNVRLYISKRISLRDVFHNCERKNLNITYSRKRTKMVSSEDQVA